MVVRQVRSLDGVGVEATVLDIDGRGRSYARALWKILALNVARRRYDVVHAHTGHSGVLACFQLRSPVVLSYVGYDLDVPTGSREALRRKVERTLFRQISRVIAASIVKSRRSFERLPRRARRRATILPNGVDRDLFRPMPRSHARARLGWGDEPVVLFAANPARAVKRVELAQRAVEVAAASVPRVRLAICDRVPPDEMPVWLNAADVLVLTSWSEGSPNVVKEAMACNVPVVSVDVGDVRDVVEGTLHCHVCEPDAAALGRALTAVLLAGSRSNGRERTQHLDLAAIARRLRTVYDQAAERGPGPFGFHGRALIPPRRDRRDSFRTDARAGVAVVAVPDAQRGARRLTNTDDGAG